MAGGPLSHPPPPPTWAPVPEGSGFGMANLPFGVASIDHDRPHVVVAIGNHVLDLDRLRKLDLLDLPKAATRGSLNPLLGILGAVRARVSEVLTDERLEGTARRAMVPGGDVELRRPIEVADFVDFYSSEVHATRVGRIFRPGADPLPTAWRSLPIGYHGRAGTVVASGTPIRRPRGVRLVDGEPRFGPSEQLDFEVEVGAVIGRPAAGPVAASTALSHVAGFVVVNDWSARDIQSFEYQPLGPFAGKSFATTIGTWLVVRDALAPFVTEPPTQEPAPLPHLAPAGPTWRIHLDAAVNGHSVAGVDFASMYWTVAQQIAHLTANGATLRPGDLLGSGTISVDRPGGAGCLLEATAGGTEPIDVGGEPRLWLADGDTVTITAHCEHGPTRVEFGAATGTIVREETT